MCLFLKKANVEYKRINSVNLSFSAFLEVFTNQPVLLVESNSFPALLDSYRKNIKLH